MGGIVRRVALVIAAFTMAWSAPAVTQGVEQSLIAVDAETRAKFPGEDGELVDTLAYINSHVNRLIEPMGDKEQYGVDEHWVMAPASMKGDCEDYTLTKLLVLSEARFPVITNSRVRGVILYENGKVVGGHAILELLLPSGSIMFLDNLHAKPMTRAELVADGYRFFDW